MIAVPSRLSLPPSRQKPLNGLRISVKDNIDLRGVKTAIACRAWDSLYLARDATAPAISRLTELGAVVVGKTKCSQFAETEAPTADWVDVHCPFNARADGYLSPGGSTSGGAAALAAYDWLDVSIGTDSRLAPFSTLSELTSCSGGQCASSGTTPGRLWHEVELCRTSHGLDLSPLSVKVSALDLHCAILSFCKVIGLSGLARQKLAHSREYCQVLAADPGRQEVSEGQDEAGLDQWSLAD